ncbi:MAG: YceD family protein [Novosphingobium sp.]|jgi:uncharacterized metal-binding protein YceD (DUF177 family)
MTMTPEFSRTFDIREAGGPPVVLEPTEAERKRLATRFQLASIDEMRARLSVTGEGQVFEARGQVEAKIMQFCAISGEEFAVSINEPVALRFVPPENDHSPDEEIELTAADCDEIEYEGTSFDLGEAVAQSLALAIDPFAEGPDADKARAEHNLAGDAASGPFAALAALKKD